MNNQITVIAFDADDTLWVNEPYFRETEDKFAALLEDFMPRHSLIVELYKTEIANLPLYGFGIKGFMLSMIETALRVTMGKNDPKVVEMIIELGQEMLNKPIELLDGVEEVLKALHGKYKLVVATKGDLLDQQRKLTKSGLDHYFHHIEIMSDKQEKDYQKLLKHLDCNPESFLMLGNSLKSDVLPVLNIGGHAVHIPYHTTWVHESIDHTIEHPNFYEMESLSEVLVKLIE
ncbi:HAD family hydrolase [Pedobacter kyungheensis]|uniref:HAD family hydrolase n=2 Tax=Pedobacter TaxID=84567 RepID=A0A0C1FQK5_9SPHI|nr:MULTISPECIES: HAD family hydrolase [Pedobacter]KIA94053.1 HAD family hydrolase [Pedobacter kyungheensis]SDE13925.1 putative hydrolase of the HAD superfamily [Pedobacter soli]